ncbi:hypothetical protein SK128_007833, partial [Halocaridina rubra]
MTYARKAKAFIIIVAIITCADCAEGQSDERQNVESQSVGRSKCRKVKVSKGQNVGRSNCRKI